MRINDNGDDDTDDVDDDDDEGDNLTLETNLASRLLLRVRYWHGGQDDYTDNG